MALISATLAKQYHHTYVSIYTYITGYCFVPVIIATYLFKNNFAKIKLKF